MITAIITQLKTGTITAVIARADGIANLKGQVPYIVVWQADRLITGNAQGIGGVYVAMHSNPGAGDAVDEYMENEVITLLHDIVLTDIKGNKFRLQDTNEITPLVTTNDDGTISRDRLFSLPKLGSW